jgi:type III secretion protein Q
MMMPLLALRQVKAEAVAARRRLGCGIRMPFQVSSQQGELLLEPGRPPGSATPICFETACGVLGFSEPGPLLSLLGECPVTLALADNDPDSWFWDLFLYHLSPQVRKLLGHLRLLGGSHSLPFGCRLTVTLGMSQVSAYLWLTHESFLAVCDAGPWRSIAAPLPERFQVAIAVTLGRLQLSISHLRTARSGDVVVIEQPFFNARGVGYLQVGERRLHGHIDDASGHLCLTLASLEETSVDEDFAVHDFPKSGDEQPVADVFGHEPFDELSMALNVRCGTLNLTLGELRNLSPGAVLGISGYAPGMAGLYYGDRPIGVGQLVEVDGCLGLQLSRMTFSR